jgi:hypothetical protein
MIVGYDWNSGSSLNHHAFPAEIDNLFFFNMLCMTQTVTKFDTMASMAVTINSGEYQT